MTVRTFSSSIVQHKTGTATQWTSANPVLAKGEIGIEIDTNKFKFGDGVAAWNSLAYCIGGLTNYYTKTEIDTNMAPLASPVFTGTAKGNFIENTQQLGTLTGKTTINCANGSIAIATLGAAIAINLSAEASTSTCRICTLILTNGGSHVITWANSIKWAEGLAPALTASGTDIITFITTDNGGTWYGALNGSAFS